MQDRSQLYIGGAWVTPSEEGRLDVLNASTEEMMGRVPEGTTADVDRAVAAARAAFPLWSATPVAERAKALQRIAEGLQARTTEIGTTVAGEVGMPLNLSMVIQAGLPTITFASMPELLDSFRFDERIGSSLVLREPVGVVGCITPWNYPLHQAAAKVAPALAAGCTTVLKPSEIAPLSAFVLAEVIDEVGLPPGVFNLVTGVGAVVGEALASHPDVDMVSFTGSTAAGRRVATVAAATVKRVALELGGKSPNVLLEDAPLERAVTAGVGAAFINSGQTCIALSRMIVPRSKLAEVEALATEAAGEYTPGDALGTGTRLGPLASAAQRDRVRAHIRRAEEQGARLLCGGAEAPEGLEKGFFVRPTIFSDVRSDMAIARDEVFGPVLAIMPYDTEDEAVAIANDTIYGLSGAVWSADPERAKSAARLIRAGQIEINGGIFNPLAPFGGYKQSGIGRELGRYGLEEFLEVKSLQL